MPRLDRDGRDVTELTGLWDDSDRIIDEDTYRELIALREMRGKISEMLGGETSISVALMWIDHWRKHYDTSTNSSA